MRKPYSVMLGMVLMCVLAASMGVSLQMVPATLPSLTAAGGGSVDNGPLLSAWAAAGEQVPPGRYYLKTPVRLRLEGAQLRGSGMPSQIRGDSAWDSQNCTMLIWNGPLTDPVTTTVGTLTSQTVFTIPAGSSVDGAYTGYFADFTDATSPASPPAVVRRMITGYVGATKTVTIESAGITLAVGDTVYIHQAVVSHEASTQLVEDIGISGRWDAVTNPGIPNVKLVEFTNDFNSQAVGAIRYNRVFLGYANQGIYADDKPSPPFTAGHCDHMTFTNIISQKLTYALTCDENQAVEWYVWNWIAKDGGTTFARIRRGGRFDFNFTPLDAWTSWIEYGEGAVSGSNAGYIRAFVFLDAGPASATNSVVEHANFTGAAAPTGLTVDLTGFAAQDCTAGDPIIRTHTSNPSRISVLIKKAGGDIDYP